MNKRRSTYIAPCVESFVIQPQSSLLRRSSFRTSADTTFLDIEDDDISLFDEILDNGDF